MSGRRRMPATSETVLPMGGAGQMYRLRLKRYVVSVACDGPSALEHGEVEQASDAAAVFRAVVNRTSEWTAENFGVIMLDTRGQVIAAEIVAIGTLTNCLVHPREVLLPAVRHKAAQIVVMHNHPSGDVGPSPEDEELTARLAAACEVLGIPLLDSLVVTPRGYRSIPIPTGRRPW